ncbi:MAG: hypothetical protein WDO19_22010 [Bacteroidota bacterium]
MATYLLLRNNKESGPYSLEGLVQLGLKPYDLVWVEGRSAAWRYPSEVDDLKFYAPVVEEQPYDRFYKRPSEEKKEKEKQETAFQQVKHQVVSETEPINIPEAKKDIGNVEINIPKKQVFVSMPANSGKTVFIKKTETAKVTASAGAVNDLYSNNQDSFKKTEPVISPASPSYSELVNDYNNQYAAEKKTAVIKEAVPSYDESYPVETKYSQSLDDIKDMYVQTLAERKRKNAQRKMVMVMVKKVVPFAAVLIAGMLMGVFIMNRKNGNENLSQTPQTIVPKIEPVNTKTDLNQAQQQIASQTDQTLQQTGENKVSGSNEADLAKNGSQKDITADKQNNLNGSPANTKKDLSKANKTTTTNTGNTNTVLTQPKNIEPDPVTGERNKIVRSSEPDNTNSPAAAAAVRQLPVTAWKQVSVKSNEYKRGTFGGIHDLQITVTNNSNFLLDNVLVELQYLKPSDQPLKTDNIRFSPVPANGSLTLAIPPTTRGVKVSCKIIHVESKAAGNDTAGL